MKTKILFLAFTLSCFAIFHSGAAHAKLNVVTSTSDLAAVTREIAASDADVESIAKGTQDPHFIEAKPSFMTKASHADLLITIGLELEIGWIPPIVQGARNPKIKTGERGYLEVGPLVSRLEVSSGDVTRAEGDVHPDGNPHVFLDPIRTGEIAVKIAERMGELDSAHAPAFKTRAQALQKRLAEKTKSWQARVDRTKIRKIVTYHKTLTYFFDRFKIENPILLEPKPGIPPTGSHIMEVINTIKSQKIPLVWVENFFDPSPLKRLTDEIPGLKTAVVAVTVEGDDNIKSIDDLYESLVKQVEKGAAK